MGAQRVEAVTFAVTDRDDQPLGTITPATPGEITCTAGRRVLRGLELLPSDWEALDPYNTLVVPSWTVDGVTTQVGVFTFYTGTEAYTPGNQQPADTAVTRSADVDQLDLSAFLDIQLAAPVGLPVGASPTPIIEGLLEAAGFLTHDVAFLPATAQEPSVFDGTALDAIDSMCQASGAHPLYFTAEGVPTVTLVPAPGDLTATRTYQPGDGLVVGTPRFPFDLFAPNRWEAVGGTDDAPQVGVYELAADVPGWQGQRGFQIIDRFDARNATDQTTLDAAARAAAVQGFADAQGLAFDTVAVPESEPWDVIDWDGTLYLEQTFTLPLRPGQTMSHKAGRVLIP